MQLGRRREREREREERERERGERERGEREREKRERERREREEREREEREREERERRGYAPTMRRPWPPTLAGSSGNPCPWPCGPPIKHPHHPGGMVEEVGWAIGEDGGGAQGEPATSGFTHVWGFRLCARVRATGVANGIMRNVG